MTFTCVFCNRDLIKCYNIHKPIPGYQNIIPYNDFKKIFTSDMTIIKDKDIYVCYECILIIRLVGGFTNVLYDTIVLFLKGQYAKDWEQNAMVHTLQLFMEHLASIQHIDPQIQNKRDEAELIAEDNNSDNLLQLMYSEDFDKNSETIDKEIAKAFSSSKKKRKRRKSTHFTHKKGARESYSRSKQYTSYSEGRPSPVKSRTGSAISCISKASRNSKRKHFSPIRLRYDEDNALINRITRAVSGMRDRALEQFFPCPITVCYKKYDTFEELCQHAIEDHNVIAPNIKSYTKQINKKMENNTLKIHKYKFPCVLDYCRKNNKNLDELMDHEINKHNILACYHCQECYNKKFTTKDELTLHKKKVHDKVGLICYLCSLPFETFEQLQVHLKEHKCEHCEEVFVDKIELKEHKKKYAKGKNGLKHAPKARIEIEFRCDVETQPKNNTNGVEVVEFINIREQQIKRSVSTLIDDENELEMPNLTAQFVDEDLIEKTEISVANLNEETTNNDEVFNCKNLDNLNDTTINANECMENVDEDEESSIIDFEDDNNRQIICSDGIIHGELLDNQNYENISEGNLEDDVMEDVFQTETGNVKERLPIISSNDVFNETEVIRRNCEEIAQETPQKIIGYTHEALMENIEDNQDVELNKSSDTLIIDEECIENITEMNNSNDLNILKKSIENVDEIDTIIHEKLIENIEENLEIIRGKLNESNDKLIIDEAVMEIMPTKSQENIFEESKANEEIIPKKSKENVIVQSMEEIQKIIHGKLNTSNDNLIIDKESMENITEMIPNKSIDINIVEKLMENIDETLIINESSVIGPETSMNIIENINEINLKDLKGSGFTPTTFENNERIMQKNTIHAENIISQKDLIGNDNKSGDGLITLQELMIEDNIGIIQEFEVSVVNVVKDQGNELIEEDINPSGSVITEEINTALNKEKLIIEVIKEDNKITQKPEETTTAGIEVSMINELENAEKEEIVLEESNSCTDSTIDAIIEGVSVNIMENFNESSEESVEIPLQIQDDDSLQHFKLSTPSSSSDANKCNVIKNKIFETKGDEINTRITKNKELDTIIKGKNINKKFMSLRKRRLDTKVLKATLIEENDSSVNNSNNNKIIEYLNKDVEETPSKEGLKLEMTLSIKRKGKGGNRKQINQKIQPKVPIIDDETKMIDKSNQFDKDIQPIPENKFSRKSKILETFDQDTSEVDKSKLNRKSKKLQKPNDLIIQEKSQLSGQLSKKLETDRSTCEQSESKLRRTSRKLQKHEPNAQEKTVQLNKFEDFEMQIQENTRIEELKQDFQSIKEIKSGNSKNIVELDDKKQPNDLITEESNEEMQPNDSITPVRMKLIEKSKKFKDFDNEKQPNDSITQDKNKSVAKLKNMKELDEEMQPNDSITQDKNKSVEKLEELDEEMQPNDSITPVRIKLIEKSKKCKDLGKEKQPNDSIAQDKSKSVAKLKNMKELDEEMQPNDSITQDKNKSVEKLEDLHEEMQQNDSIAPVRIKLIKKSKKFKDLGKEKQPNDSITKNKNKSIVIPKNWDELDGEKQPYVLITPIKTKMRGKSKKIIATKSKKKILNPKKNYESAEDMNIVEETTYDDLIESNKTIPKKRKSMLRNVSIDNDEDEEIIASNIDSNPEDIKIKLPQKASVIKPESELILKSETDIALDVKKVKTINNRRSKRGRFIVKLEDEVIKAKLKSDGDVSTSIIKVPTIIENAVDGDNKLLKYDVKIDEKVDTKRRKLIDLSVVVQESIDQQAIIDNRRSSRSKSRSSDVIEKEATTTQPQADVEGIRSLRNSGRCRTNNFDKFIPNEITNRRKAPIKPPNNVLDQLGDEDDDDDFFESPITDPDPDYPITNSVEEVSEEEYPPKTKRVISINKSIEIIPSISKQTTSRINKRNRKAPKRYEEPESNKFNYDLNILLNSASSSSQEKIASKLVEFDKGVLQIDKNNPVIITPIPRKNNKRKPTITTKVIKEDTVTKEIIKEPARKRLGITSNVKKITTTTTTTTTKAQIVTKVNKDVVHAFEQAINYKPLPAKTKKRDHLKASTSR